MLSGFSTAEGKEKIFKEIFIGKDSQWKISDIDNFLKGNPYATWLETIHPYSELSNSIFFLILVYMTKPLKTQIYPFRIREFYSVLLLK